MLCDVALALQVAPHPWLELAAFTTAFPRPLGEIFPPASLVEALRPDAPAPLTADDEVRAAVRALLRAGGFRPAGRSKPASEYLRGAAEAGRLAPINPAVDACNAASLHSGLPISVVDVDRLSPPLRVVVAADGDRYVFNPAGQEIDLGGLLVLADAAGPCANAVKDAQRTKTDANTLRTLSIVWGTRALPGRAEATASWYRTLLKGLGADTEPVSAATTAAC
jgi:DNA/RNA-binding domain of Phe-tRNA-synthetase-like protein